MRGSAADRTEAVSRKQRSESRATRQAIVHGIAGNGRRPAVDIDDRRRATHGHHCAAGRGATLRLSVMDAVALSPNTTVLPATGVTVGFLTHVPPFGGGSKSHTHPIFKSRHGKRRDDVATVMTHGSMPSAVATLSRHGAANQTQSAAEHIV